MERETGHGPHGSRHGPGRVGIDAETEAERCEEETDRGRAEDESRSEREGHAPASPSRVTMIAIVSFQLLKAMRVLC